MFLITFSPPNSESGDRIYRASVTVRESFTGWNLEMARHWLQCILLVGNEILCWEVSSPKCSHPPPTLAVTAGCQNTRTGLFRLCPELRAVCPSLAACLREGSHAAMETLLGPARSKAGLGLGAAGGSQGSRGAPRPPCGAERLPAHRAHTHADTRRVSRRGFECQNTKREGFIGVELLIWIFVQPRL